MKFPFTQAVEKINGHLPVLFCNEDISEIPNPLVVNEAVLP
jgi:hypothetical protein